MKEEVPVKKNEEYVVKIADYGTDGEGIAKINDFTVFVAGALKNEKCKIHITKVLSSYAYAKIVEILEKSEHRVQSDCKTYPKCGGCSLRHIDYKETLQIKRQKVQNLVKKMLNDKIIVDETVGMDKPVFYRNKAIYPISPNKMPGIFAARSHDVIEFEECKIQTINSQKIAKFILENWDNSIYDEKTGKGLLRNIMIREGFATNEIMVVLVQNGDKKYDASNLVKEFPNIKTVAVNVNTKNTNVVLANKNIICYGEGFIYDKLGGYTFKISPNSFYQVNPKQTEKLYNLAVEKANLKADDILCDLYCGIGTIGIFASKYVKKVYGIEIVESAVKDANENAKLNNVNNIEFILGDTEKAFDSLLKNDIKPTVVIVDPPRKGLDDTTIENLCKLKLDRVVYVSCNPATLVRDLAKMEEIYIVKNITPVDNFCYSSHVESVTVLELK